MKRIIGFLRNHSYLRRLLICAVLFGMLFRFEYATDTYWLCVSGLQSFSEVLFANGRLLTFGFVKICDLLSFSVPALYAVSTVLAVVFAALAWDRLARLLELRLKHGTAGLLAFFTVLNPFVIEYFLFIEKGIFLFGLAMSICAAEFFTRFLLGKRRCLPFAYLFLMLAAFTYQVLPAAFAVLAVLFAICIADTVKKFVTVLLLAISVYGFGGIVQLLFVKLVGHSSRTGGGVLFGNLLRGLLPLGLPTLAVYAGAVVLLLGVSYWLAKRYSAERVRTAFGLNFLKLFCLLAAGLLVTAFPFIFLTPSEVWLPFRILYPMGLLPGAYLIWFGWNFSRGGSGEKIFFKVILVLTVLDVLFFQVAMVGRIINNETDRRVAEQIGEQIELYEAETGNRVTHIAVYHDAKVTRANPWVLWFDDSNVRAFYKDWSDVNVLSVILEREFVKAAPDGELYARTFAGKDWKAFSADQLCFDGNVLHLCVY